MAVFHMLLQALAHSIRLFGRVRFANIARFHLRRHGVKIDGRGQYNHVRRQHLFTDFRHIVLLHAVPAVAIAGVAAYPFFLVVKIIPNKPPAASPMPKSAR